jgi:nucleotide-binding universal stress UspA family protein
MYNKILVPLDGSKLAECALPHAEELAKGCNTEEVILISVTERIQGYRPTEDPSQTLGQRLAPEAVGKPKGILAE